jgi:hypothetical protein
MTVIEAVLQVMRESGAPMTPSQVFEAIRSKNLYSFGAQSPLGIVRSNMRRHSDVCPPEHAASILYLRADSKELYSLMREPVKRTRNAKG